MKNLGFAGVACLLSLFVNCSCSTPPVPPEAARASALEQDLWRAGGSLLIPRDYEAFRSGLKDADGRIEAEKARFGWFRDYSRIQADLQKLVAEGEALLRRIDEDKAARAKTFALSAETLAARIESLHRITQYFNENDDIRKNASQAEIKLVEARMLVSKEKYEPASAAAAAGEVFLERAEEAAVRLLERYLDSGQLAKWRRWAEEAVKESQDGDGVAILVNKVERRLTVYEKGKVRARYDIGLGKYGLSDKRRAGDEATPEGRYKVVKKIPASKFYKALLIDYPNEDDKRFFAEAKRRGQIPSHAGIGGAIEIHGGGKDSLTKGCVGLEDKDMDDIYAWSVVGTPVTIVGATDVENTILDEIRKFKKNVR